MADWSTPDLADAYADFLDSLVGRDEDAGTLFVNAPTNQPTGSIRYARASNKFQEWSGAAWVDKVLSIAGGGTGGATAAAARTSLGLGTMATQDSNAVTITGGDVAADLTGSTNLDADELSAGTVPTARLGSGAASAATFLRGDQAWAAIPISDVTHGADQSANFAATVNKTYNLTGSHTVTLPTVVGNDGKLIVLIMIGTGVWLIDPAGTETILGAVTYSFDWPQYSAIVLKADANDGKWDIV